MTIEHAHMDDGPGSGPQPNATLVLLDAVGYEGNTRNDVAQRYAWGLQQGGVEWKVVNEAIIERWSLSGLKYVKKLAWRMSGHPKRGEETA